MTQGLENSIHVCIRSICLLQIILVFVFVHQKKYLLHSEWFLSLSCLSLGPWRHLQSSYQVVANSSTCHVQYSEIPPPLSRTVLCNMSGLGQKAESCCCFSADAAAVPNIPGSPPGPKIYLLNQQNRPSFQKLPEASCKCQITLAINNRIRKTIPREYFCCRYCRFGLSIQALFA